MGRAFRRWAHLALVGRISLNSALRSPTQPTPWTAETVERLPWNDSEVPVAHEEEDQKPNTAEDDQTAGTCRASRDTAATALITRMTGWALSVSGG